MTVIRRPATPRRPRPRVLLVDNYDSFTYNLAHLLCEAGAEVDVRRHDAVRSRRRRGADPTHLVVSPGPGRPSEAGISATLIRSASPDSVPVLGVCLGHQCIVEELRRRRRTARSALMHGKVGRVARSPTTRC